MKLGSRPDIFFTTEEIRTVTSEVSTDLKIQVQNSLFLLHKFPLLSKCFLLQKLGTELADSHGDMIIKLPNIPGGVEAFEVCAKFCYGITITLSSLNLVPVRCAAEYLGMRDDIDKGNLIGKLDIFFKSCVLRRWKDTLVTLQSTRQYAPLCEEFGLTSSCIDAIAATIVANPTKANWSQGSQKHKSWWGEDIAELRIDHYWRIMVALRSSGRVSDKIIGDALQVYAFRWLPILSVDGYQSKKLAENSRLLLERIVGLLPSEKGSVSCSFLLKLLKACNTLNSSSTSRHELLRRVGVQLEEASVSDLLIPKENEGDNQYDVDIVRTMLEEFMLQGMSPPTSPPRRRPGLERRRSRSAEKMDFEGLDNSRRSSSASHSSKLRVAKLIDGYLQEIAGDPNLPLEKVIELAEAVPDFARPNHDDLYKFIDIYLRAHPELNKSGRKRLCRVLDCRKLSVEACMHAAQNELLPLRLVVQVLFFEQARAAMSGSQVSGLPSNIRALLSGNAGSDEDNDAPEQAKIGASSATLDEDWSLSGFKYQDVSKIATLKMKLAEDDGDFDDVVMQRGGLVRSSSSKLRTLCSIPSRPKKMLSKLWAMNRSVNERH